MLRLPDSPPTPSLSTDLVLQRGMVSGSMSLWQLSPRVRSNATSAVRRRDGLAAADSDGRSQIARVSASPCCNLTNSVWLKSRGDPLWSGCSSARRRSSFDGQASRSASVKCGSPESTGRAKPSRPDGCRRSRGNREHGGDGRAHCRSRSSGYDRYASA